MDKKLEHIKYLVAQRILISTEHAQLLIKEIEKQERQLTEAEKALEQYADRERWSSTFVYEEEDYRSVDANGCPDSHSVSIDLPASCLWADEIDGSGLAEEYFNKFYPVSK